MCEIRTDDFLDDAFEPVTDVSDQLGSETVADQRDVIEALEHAFVAQTVQPVDQVLGHRRQPNDGLRVKQFLRPIRPVDQHHVGVRQVHGFGQRYTRSHC